VTSFYSDALIDGTSVQRGGLSLGDEHRVGSRQHQLDHQVVFQPEAVGACRGGGMR
jgi:hypothetical protein